MNVPRYIFRKESEPELVKFLKIVEHKTQNTNCNSNEYQLWNKLLPPDPILIQKLDAPISEVIDLCSDEEPVSPQIIVNENLEDNVHLPNSTVISSIRDIAFAIKENLETQHDLSESARDTLFQCLNNELEELFELLNQTLNSEDIFYLGVSFKDNFSNPLIICFCHYLLIPSIRKEYCDNLLMLVKEYSIKYSLILKDELLAILYEISEKEIKIFIQYINNLNADYQSVLLRDFIFSIDILNENYLRIIENLMNNQIEYEALSKLVEMLSNIAEDHSRDKVFGKLIMSTIQFLGPNVMLLEQPLKHLIARHKSVWRSKLEKTFTTCYEDSLMFSQSFRD